jgi:hypothetical protein
MKQWKDVPGFEGLYKASNECEIFSYITNKVIKPTKLKNRYKTVTLRKDGVSDTFIFSRVICMAFHGLPPEKNYQVNHKNGDKEDDRPENLEWCTRSENQIHAIKTGLATHKFWLGRWRKAS